MTSITLFLSLKYFFSLKNNQSISLMLKISFFSILISTFALSLIISIMKGFEVATYEKMQNIHPQLIMQSNNGYLNYDKINRILKKEFSEIKSINPIEVQTVIISNQYNQDDITNIIFLKGIDPLLASNTTNIEKKITKKIYKNFENLFDNNSVIIGEKLANELNITIGDTITLLIPQKHNKLKLTFEKIQVIVTGFFNTGIEDFDCKLIITSLNYLFKLFPESGITQLEIKLKDNINETEIINNLKTRFKVNVFSWKDLYLPLVSALKLEKYSMYFILYLIILMACINIISLLFMIINFKKKDFAILKSFGLSYNNLKYIFLIIGLIITISATIGGLLLSFISGLILKTFPFIKLPDVYFAEFLPIKMEFYTFILIFWMNILISFFAILIGLKNLKSINISNELKN